MDEPRELNLTNEKVENIVRELVALGMEVDEVMAAINSGLQFLIVFFERINEFVEKIIWKSLADVFEEEKNSDDVEEISSVLIQIREKREWMKVTEQKYRAKIKHFERITLFRKIYKPP